MHIQSLKMRRTLGEELLIPSLKFLISIWIIIPIIVYGAQSSADGSENSACREANSQFSGIKNLLYDIALVTKENRKVRNQQNTSQLSGLDLESVQGRFWCLQKGPAPKPNEIPSKAQLKKNYTVENATVVFDSGTVLTSRHSLLNEDGTPCVHPQNCFFEHIKSGQLFRATDQGKKYLPLSAGDDPSEDDVAILRLERAIPGVTPIKETDMLINSPKENGTAFTVVSNYARNAPGGNREALTITNCSQMNNTATPNRVLSKIIQTDCNTGRGSSAAQVYVDDNGSPKLFAIATGEIVKPHVREGTGYKLNTLSTLLVRFDSSLTDLYQSLPPLQQDAALKPFDSK